MLAHLTYSVLILCHKLLASHLTLIHKYLVHLHVAQGHVVHVLVMPVYMCLYTCGAYSLPMLNMCGEA